MPAQIHRVDMVKIGLPVADAARIYALGPPLSEMINVRRFLLCRH